LTYVDVDAGMSHSLGLRSDGSVVAWGSNTYGQCNVPGLPSLQTFVEVSAGHAHSVGLLSDGNLVVWGDNTFGQWNVPPLPAGTQYVEAATGGGHTVALRSDGEAVAWGYNANGQCVTPQLPNGTTYVEVSAGRFHSLACRSDGALLAWGDNSYQQCVVPTQPLGVGFYELAAGGFHGIARMEDLPCGGSETYCMPPAPNSVGPGGALFQADGCADLPTNTLVFEVVGLPSKAVGIFIYGAQQTKVPFGNGFACIAGTVVRVLPPVLSTSAGTLSVPIDLHKPPFSQGAGQILPGSDWNFQYWYRDSNGAPTTYNLSNGVRIVFAP
jgi:alpha-tubulin suppressor-like RCC1 family protein